MPSLDGDGSDDRTEVAYTVVLFCTSSVPLQCPGTCSLLPTFSTHSA